MPVKAKEEGRRWVFRIAAINIAADPHPPGIYEHLFDAARRSKEPVIFYGKKAGELGDYEKRHIDGDEALIGEFHTFTNIDTRARWFDLKAKEPIDPDDIDLSEIENKSPEYTPVQFMFLLKKHLLVFDAALTPNMMERLVQRTFEQAAEQEKVTLNTTIIPESETVDAIFAMRRLDTLTIHIRPPNPDHDADLEESIMNGIAAENAEFKEITLKAKNEVGLTPSEQTRREASVAQDNGYVFGKGKTETGAPEELNTREHPRIQRVLSDPNVRRAAAFVGAAMTFVADLLRSRRR